MHWPEVEPAISRSQVRRPTTTQPSHPALCTLNVYDYDFLYVIWITQIPAGEFLSDFLARIVGIVARKSIRFCCVGGLCRFAFFLLQQRLRTKRVAAVKLNSTSNSIINLYETAKAPEFLVHCSVLLSP